ncbi:cholesterol transport system auxiliary component [Poseidonocella pacifica]|uniref:Cholesterol transport system auxiliary component n=1 Tax=Poseidonocella pacifica TaxID=871651 RepID=A0A1I0XF90_9RHOB|nr:ABC-type transport auxiliary lipoprotein family protein [Poseidonocella pacifica]SFA98928.1 cholesterol transport system auxiliary component [Poseidonocella pacifica]
MLRPLMMCFLLALPGCSAIGALSDAAEPLDAYELRGEGARFAATGSLRSDLTVELPTVSGALDTDRILVRPSPLEASYLPDARWTDPAPEMVQTVILRRMEASGGFRFVGRRPLGTVGDYALLTELTDLQADVSADGRTVTRVALTATLIRENDAAVLARRSFAGAAETSGTTPQAIVPALDAAMSQMLTELGPWVLRTAGIGVRSGS